MSDFFSSEKFVRFTEKTIYKLLGGFADSLNDGPSFINASDYDSEFFFKGNKKFRKTVSKNAKAKVKELYNWNKIAQDTHFTYQKAICQTMAEKQANQIAQEKAKKTKSTDTEVTNLLAFKKKHAYA